MIKVDVEKDRFLRTVVLSLVSFFLARVFLPGDIIPLGFAFFAVSLEFKVNSMVVGIASIVGALSTGFNARSVIVIISILLLLAVNILLPIKRKRGIAYSAIIATICNVAASVFVIYINGFLMYDLLVSLVQSAVSLIGFFIFYNVMPLFVSNNKDKILTPEELACAAITIILCISGLPEISIFQIQLRNVLSVFLLIIFSYKGGFEVGASVGIIVGLLVGIPGYELYGIATSIAVYSFCGFMSGLLNKLGKIGSILGFIIGNASLAIMLSGSTEILMPLRDISIAGSIFILIPTKLMDYIKMPENMSFNGVVIKANYSDEVKRITIDKLNNFGDCLSELAKTFNEICQKETASDKERVLRMMDKVVSKVCAGCAMKEFCWDRSFFETYQTIFKLIETLDKKGRLKKEDIPLHFANRCDRAGNIAHEVSYAYEMYKLEVLWSKRLEESREIYGEQLKSLSRLIKGFAVEVDVDLRFLKSAEDSILVELNKSGYKVNSVSVYENKWGKYEVTLEFKGCGGRRVCINVLSGIISEIIGRKMIVGDDSKNYGRKLDNGFGCNYVSHLKRCKVHFIEEEKLRVMSGVCEKSKDSNKVSGDSFSIINYGEGKYIAAICDGMGTGKMANKQSKAAIGLLEQFIEAGFDKESAIKMINSLFVMKSDNEIFSTLDLTVIDLHTGKVEFIKHGSMPTIIKRSTGTNGDYSIDVVASNTLPIGIISKMESSVINNEVSSGDFIIMMSDGIFECFRVAGKRQDDIIHFIEECDTVNPQEMANRILNEAISLARLAARKDYNKNLVNLNEGSTAPVLDSEIQDFVPDDMLVMVLKVWEKI